MANMITLRVQSAQHGTKRLQVGSEFGLDGGHFSVYQNRNKTGQLDPTKTKHGDMLYLSQSETAVMDCSDSSTDLTAIASEAPVPLTNGLPKSKTNLHEQDVDRILEKTDGRIQRERNEQMCRHGPSGKCFHCVPLEPFDEEYLKNADPPIKFLSFHSYIRKLRSGVDKGKFVSLENISCKIKAGCKEHPPWPGGICTKCQPNAITLNRQRYRHVDYIQFENPMLVERFLNYWRGTGNQRVGFMYGRYEQHSDVPLGIRAVVAAIYEPPQESTRNSVKLLPDEREEAVEQVADQLGLCRVGWIFSDLVAQDLQKGTVKHFRGNIDSHFLSAEECIMAADLQNKHPNPCKLSSDGHFGSKFVTVVVTGDANNQIHFEGYQVSNQCMALVRDKCLIPTLDAPELGYIKESSNEQYVPDVFYKLKDNYGNEVTQLARPLPVEYLLVDLPAAFPVDPVFTFLVDASKKPFPVANRSEIGDLQDFMTFSSYLQQFSRAEFIQSVADFHVLIFLYTCDMLPLKDVMGELLTALRTKDENLAYHWSKSEEWGTVEQLVSSNSPTVSRQGSYVGPNAQPLPPISPAASGGATWTCKHCTFINPPGKQTCDMCNLPQS